MLLKRIFLVILIITLFHSNSYALSRTSSRGMFSLYDENFKQGIGNYITVDFILTAYSMLIKDVITDMENMEIYPAFKELVSKLNKSIEKNKNKEKAYNMASAYLSVIEKLLDPDAVIKEEVLSSVTKELKAIESHSGVGLSAVTGVKEDFTQYAARGKYANSEASTRYFKAMMYASRMAFYLKESRATGVNSNLADIHTGVAILLSKAIDSNKELMNLYDSINDGLNFFVGKSDDLGVSDYIDKKLKSRQDILLKVKEEKRLPRILSAIVDVSALEKGVSVPEVTAGFRLFGQRFTIDSYAFGQLVYDNVSYYKGKGAPFTLSVINGQKVRGFPTVLDIMAALGSEYGRKIIDTLDDSNYDGYDKNFVKVSRTLKEHVSRPENLSNMNLKIVYILANKDSIMSLNTAVGFWILGKYNASLYSKQSYTAMAKSLFIPPKRTKAYIEPAMDVYLALIENLSHIKNTVNDKKIKTKILEFTEIIKKAHSISHKQETGGLDGEDHTYLNNINALFSKIVYGKDFPVVTDVHTEGNMVLEEGIGYPLSDMMGKLKGARFNSYEFKQLANERLSDAAWQKMLKDGDVKGAIINKLIIGKDPG